jgi:exopolyphosphatase / guanosine-5'-triphosphate,3'-diphosphate pyrophosphatase
MSDSEPEFVAAIDLGSNSFHMVIAKASGGRIRVVDRMKSMVQLAAGLTDDNQMTTDVMQRALATLRRFGQRLRDFPPGSVRAVGTNTLRRAHNSAEFMLDAESALGHPIEVIAGREEARLIYLGVSHNSADIAEQRLVVDIGGGSTEFIIGRRFTPVMMESLYMGCVEMSRRCFADGAITAERMRRAELLAAQELEVIQTPYKRVGWGHVIGASGTILAVRDVVRTNGWSDDGISRSSLQRLRNELIERGHVEKLTDLAGLQSQRAPVFAGGVAILSAAFDALEIRRMHSSDGALREGLLYDLQGRLAHADMRDDTIDELIRHFHVDLEQASRVERTALNLRAQLARQWRLRSDVYGNLLAWAARLHEVGVFVAHSQYHKHGAYILTHGDLAGFSQREQSMMGALVRLHRRKFAISALETFDVKMRERLTRLAILLRVAVVLHRSRTDSPMPVAHGDEETKALTLEFPQNWLDEHPLTRADLDQEAQFVQAAGFVLDFR